jgi:hypothetical protein
VLKNYHFLISQNLVDVAQLLVFVTIMNSYVAFRRGYCPADCPPNSTCRISRTVPSSKQNSDCPADSPGNYANYSCQSSAYLR